MLKDLLNSFASRGRVEWIGLRPARKAPMQVVETAVISENGLVGDRRENPGKRAITLVQMEHLPVIAALAGLDNITPDLLRRNILVSGINLLALRHHEIKVGGVILRTTGLCAPCSYMEKTLGKGGYNAVRGHGGLTAEVVEGGEIAVGSIVEPLSRSSG